MDRLITHSVVFFLAFLFFQSAAQGANSFTEANDLRNKALSLDPVSGETVDKVDPHSGNLTIQHQDLVLPGNGGMDIVVWRIYNMSSMSAGLSASGSLSYRWAALGPGWSINAAPRLSEINTYDIQGLKPLYSISRLQRLCSNVGVVRGYIYNFLTLQLPDGTSEAFYFTGAYEAKSKNNWKLRCSSGQVTAVSPNGLTHHFGSVSTDRYVGLFKLGIPEITTIGGRAAPSLSETYMVAKSTTDLYGNQLTYSYKQLGNVIRPVSTPYNGWWPTTTIVDSNVEKPARLLARVESNDGRSVSFTYDDNSARLVSMSDNLGRTWSYNYTTAGSNHPQVLSAVTLPEGLEWKYQYAPGTYRTSKGKKTISPLDIASISAGKLSKLTYPTGGSVNYFYNYYNHVLPPGDFYSRGERVARRTLSTGPSWSYSYSRGGLGQYDTTTVTGPDGITAYKHMGTGYATWIGEGKLQYQNNIWQVGKLMEKTHPSGATEKYTWRRRELVNAEAVIIELGVMRDERIWAADLAKKTIVRDGATYTTTYEDYDAYGNPHGTKETGPNGEERYTSFSYYNDATKWIIGKLVSEYTPAINIVYRTYDTNGRLTSITRNYVQTSYTYDTQGNVTSKTLPRGAVHYYSNYHRGIPQEENQPEGVNIYRVVDDAGNIIAETNGEGNTTHYGYDALNRVTSITPPEGESSTIEYGTNHKEMVRGDLVERTTYDPFGRVAETNLVGIKTTYVYDGYDRLTFKSNPSSTRGTSYAYDAHGRYTRISNSDNATYQEFFYNAGNIRVRDERGNSTTYVYRAYGNPLEQYLTYISTPESSASISIRRNENDLITSVTQDGVTRSYKYDDSHYLTSTTHPEVGTTTFGRDKAGNMTSKTVGGRTTSYTYDDRNRLEFVDYPGSTPDVTYTHSKTDKVLSVTSSSGVREMEYNAIGNVTSESVGADDFLMVTGYEYNRLNDLSAVTTPSGEKVSYTPDVLGRPTRVASPNATYVSNVTYWPSGQLRQVNYGNGTVSSYGQNTRLWPSSFSTQRSGTYYSNSSYSYDGVGNLLSITDTADNSYNRTLTYDRINRLTSASTPGGLSWDITYDGSGNITQQMLHGGSYSSYSYDNQNRLTGIERSIGSPITYSYDYMANVTNRGADVFQYNEAGNMTCSRCGQSNTTSYSYDGTHKRIKVTKGNQRTYEFNDNAHKQVFTLTSGGTNDGFVQYYYLDNLRIAQRATTSGSPVVTYFHNDLSGSPLLSTNASGNVVWKENYAPYGEKVNKQSSSNSNAIGFHGKPYDNSIGLSYMGARYYDPLVGRFMAVDPVDFNINNIHSANRYAYANNNPYKFVDPDGRNPLLIFTAVFAGLQLLTSSNVANAPGHSDAAEAMDSIGAVTDAIPSGRTAKATGAVVSAMTSAKKAEKRLETTHKVQTSGKHPKTSEPNSITETRRTDGSSSVTYYDGKGRAFSREDYGQQSTHGSLGQRADGRSVAHEHRFDYNDRGFPIKQDVYRQLTENGVPAGPWIGE